MLPGEILALPGLDKTGYQNFLNWVAAGAKHGTLNGLVPNEAVVRVENTPWGENRAYDAAGNMVSQYRPAGPGEMSPYGAGPSAPGAPTPEQAAASTGQALQALAPRLLQQVSETSLKAPVADQPMGTLEGTIAQMGINPNDLVDFLRRRGKTAFAV